MHTPQSISRRALLGGAASAAGAIVLSSNVATAEEKPVALKGKLKQSVCAWCYKMPLEELCAAAADIGIPSVELLGPDQWPTVKAHGLTCAMVNGPGGIEKGWNRIEHHEEFLKKSEELLPQIAAAGLPNMIVFSGNRDGISDEDGLKNCAAGLKQLAPLAEKHGVIVCMELLNSKRNHKDYQCDKSAWGVELVQQVGSANFKLLYDIYHMQIMEGDVIATIQEFHEHFAHYHTGGVPGRHEIDQTQELNYRRICEAILETGFTGYLAQEFLPTQDPIRSLRKAVNICDV